MRRLRYLVAALTLLTAGTVTPVRAAQWNPEAIAKVDIVKLRTNCPGEGEYWFPVWVVVVGGQAYVRLGGRAAGRIACNTQAPYIGVEINGERFDHVNGVPAPEEAGRVAQAMADKYTSDIIIRWFPHPLTLRLAPE